jgi:hypothetical protein
MEDTVKKNIVWLCVPFEHRGYGSVMSDDWRGVSAGERGWWRELRGKGAILWPHQNGGDVGWAHTKHLSNYKLETVPKLKLNVWSSQISTSKSLGLESLCKFPWDPHSVSQGALSWWCWGWLDSVLSVDVAPPPPSLPSAFILNMVYWSLPFFLKFASPLHVHFSISLTSVSH